MDENRVMTASAPLSAARVLPTPPPPTPEPTPPLTTTLLSTPTLATTNPLPAFTPPPPSTTPVPTTPFSTTLLPIPTPPPSAPPVTCPGDSEESVGHTSRKRLRTPDPDSSDSSRSRHCSEGKRRKAKCSGNSLKSSRRKENQTAHYQCHQCEKGFDALQEYEEHVTAHALQAEVRIPLRPLSKRQLRQWTRGPGRCFNSANLAVTDHADSLRKTFYRLDKGSSEASTLDKEPEPRLAWSFSPASSMHQDSEKEDEEVRPSSTSPLAPSDSSPEDMKPGNSLNQLKEEPITEEAVEDAASPKDDLAAVPNPTCHPPIVVKSVSLPQSNVETASQSEVSKNTKPPEEGEEVLQEQAVPKLASWIRQVMNIGLNLDAVKDEPNEGSQVAKSPLLSTLLADCPAASSSPGNTRTSTPTSNADASSPAPNNETGSAPEATPSGDVAQSSEDTAQPSTFVDTSTDLAYTTLESSAPTAAADSASSLFDTIIDEKEATPPLDKDVQQLPVENGQSGTSTPKSNEGASSASPAPDALSCSFCGRSFRQASMLSRHLEVHRRILYCDRCKQFFHSSEAMEEHVARVHNNGGNDSGDGTSPSLPEPPVTSTPDAHNATGPSSSVPSATTASSSLQSTPPPVATSVPATVATKPPPEDEDDDVVIVGSSPAKIPRQTRFSASNRINPAPAGGAVCRPTNTVIQRQQPALNVQRTQPVAAVQRPQPITNVQRPQPAANLPVIQNVHSGGVTLSARDVASLSRQQLLAKLSAAKGISIAPTVPSNRGQQAQVMNPQAAQQQQQARNVINNIMQNRNLTVMPLQPPPPPPPQQVTLTRPSPVPTPLLRNKELTVTPLNPPQQQLTMRSGLTITPVGSTRTVPVNQGQVSIMPVSSNSGLSIVPVARSNPAPAPVYRGNVNQQYSNNQNTQQRSTVPPLVPIQQNRIQQSRTQIPSNTQQQYHQQQRTLPAQYNRQPSQQPISNTQTRAPAYSNANYRSQTTYAYQQRQGMQQQRIQQQPQQRLQQLPQQQQPQQRLQQLPQQQQRLQQLPQQQQRLQQQPQMQQRMQQQPQMQQRMQQQPQMQQRVQQPQQHRIQQQYHQQQPVRQVVNNASPGRLTHYPPSSQTTNVQQQQQQPQQQQQRQQQPQQQQQPRQAATDEVLFAGRYIPGMYNQQQQQQQQQQQVQTQQQPQTYQRSVQQQYQQQQTYQQTTRQPQVAQAQPMAYQQQSTANVYTANQPQQQTMQQTQQSWSNAATNNTQPTAYTNQAVPTNANTYQTPPPLYRPPEVTQQLPASTQASTVYGQPSENPPQQQLSSSNPAVSSQDAESLRCGICSQVLGDEAQLSVHLLTHTRDSNREDDNASPDIIFCSTMSFDFQNVSVKQEKTEEAAETKAEEPEAITILDDQNDETPPVPAVLGQSSEISEAPKEDAANANTTQALETETSSIIPAAEADASEVEVITKEQIEAELADKETCSEVLDEIVVKVIEEVEDWIAREKEKMNQELQDAEKALQQEVPMDVDGMDHTPDNLSVTGDANITEEEAPVGDWEESAIYAAFEMTCPICDQSFGDNATFQQHLRSHRLSPRYKCRVCTAVFTSMEAAQHHSQFHLNPRDSTTSSQPLSSPRRKNKRKRKLSDARYRYEAMVPSPYSITCRPCGKHFRHHQLYRLHRRFCVPANENALSFFSGSADSNAASLAIPVITLDSVSSNRDSLASLGVTGFIPMTSSGESVGESSWAGFGIPLIDASSVSDGTGRILRELGVVRGLTVNSVHHLDELVPPDDTGSLAGGTLEEEETLGEEHLENETLEDDETLGDEHLSNEHLDGDDNLANEHLENDENLEEEDLEDETLANDPLADDTMEETALANDALSEEEMEDENLDETLAEDTLADETLAEESIVTETVEHETVANETLTEDHMTDAHHETMDGEFVEANFVGDEETLAIADLAAEEVTETSVPVTVFPQEDESVVQEEIVQDNHELMNGHEAIIAAKAMLDKVIEEPDNRDRHVLDSDEVLNPNVELHNLVDSDSALDGENGLDNDNILDHGADTVSEHILDSDSVLDQSGVGNEGASDRDMSDLENDNILDQEDNMETDNVLDQDHLSDMENDNVSEDHMSDVENDNVSDQEQMSDMENENVLNSVSVAAAKDNISSSVDVLKRNSVAVTVTKDAVDILKRSNVAVTVAKDSVDVLKRNSVAITVAKDSVDVLKRNSVSVAVAKESVAGSVDVLKRNSVSVTVAKDNASSSVDILKRNNVSVTMAKDNVSGGVDVLKRNNVSVTVAKDNVSSSVNILKLNNMSVTMSANPGIDKEKIIKNTEKAMVIVNKTVVDNKVNIEKKPAAEDDNSEEDELSENEESSEEELSSVKKEVSVSVAKPNETVSKHPAIPKDCTLSAIPESLAGKLKLSGITIEIKTINAQ